MQEELPHSGARTRPKVLSVCQNHAEIRPGGAEGYALDLYEAIRDAGEFDAVFLARTGAPNGMKHEPRPHPGTPISNVTDDPNQYLLYTDIAAYDYLFQRSADKETITRDYADFLRSHRPDIVHFQHTFLLGYDFLRVTKNVLPDIPIVYTLHEYLGMCHRDGQLIRTMRNELCQEASPRRCHECFPDITPQTFFMRERFVKSHFNLVDLFIATSEYVRDRYVDWGLPPEKVHVEPIALPPLDRPREEPQRKRNRFAFFGQFTPYKGTDVLLKAMVALGDDFDGHLWIHGAGLENQHPRFRELFEDLLDKTKATVTFAGPYDHATELSRVMMGADWVVVPSIWWETGPLVVWEAFQYGRPVICSDIGGMSQKVTHGVNGLQFRTGDPEDLADAMRTAVETPGLWEKLSAGIPSVPKIHDHAERVSEIYKRLLASHRPRAGERVEAGVPARQADRT
jgi:glycosyltransferase involved in cell wall biosynthesis